MAGESTADSELWGDEYLDYLTESRNIAVLEALWRVRQPDLSASLVDRLLYSGSPRLADLVVDEALAPRFGPQVDQAICNAVQKHAPQLSPARVRQLIERLRDPDPLNPPFQAQRHFFERWAMAQRGSEADSLAVDATCEKTPMSARQGGQPMVRQAAYARTAAHPALVERMALALRESLAEDPSAYTWLDGAEFVEAAGPATPKSAYLALVDALASTAPEHAPHQTFAPRLEALIAAHAGEAMLARLETSLPQNPGSQAVVSAIDKVLDPRVRQRLFLALFTQQPQLWPALQQRASAWDVDEWRVRLEAVGTIAPTTAPANLGPLLSLAPPVLARDVVQLAARFGGAANNALKAAATSIVQRRLGDLGAEPESDDLVAMIWWPDLTDEADVAFVRSVLDGAVPAPVRANVLASAFASRVISAELAAALARDNGASELLIDQLDGSSIRQLVPALYDRQSAHMSAAVKKRQTTGFSLDMAVGIAARDPAAAFEGAAKSYEVLSAAARDELLTLGEQHGTPAQQQLLERFATDQDPSGRARRARALKAIARYLPKGGAMPAYYTDSLDSSVSATREAALDAIGQVAPRDRNLVEKLRGIASKTGPNKGQAIHALDALVGDYLQALDEQPPDAVRNELLGLIGACARPGTVDPLLKHLGEAAVHDAAVVHRAAANALQEAARHTTFTPEQVHRLGELLDGDGQEADGEARQSLEEAFAAAALEDKAFLVLSDLLGIKPPSSPEGLFGVETKPLSRALTLYKLDEGRGAAGWPGVIMQLDIAAERMTRAAYLAAGESEQMKATITSDPTKPDYGRLVGALQGKLDRAKSYLGTLHDLRCSKTEYTHSGQPPTADDVSTAKTSFKSAGQILFGTLQNANQRTS